MSDEPEGMNMPELTDELAEVLTAVLNSTLDNSPSDNSAADLTAADIRRAEQQREKQSVALRVLQQLGYIHPTHTGGEWVIGLNGRAVLAAREAARKAAEHKALTESYAAVVAELHAIADAIDAVPVDGLVELTVEVRIRTTYRRDATDAAKTATVDAVASAVLAKTGTTARLGSSDTWQHKTEGRRGPVKVEIDAFVEDPTARLRELAEQERATELERLRAEVAELRRAASDDRGDQ